MALQGFVESEYLAAKLAALQADPAYTADWTGKTEDQLKVFLANVGFTPEQHYQQYGWAEGLAPNALFNQAEYKLAKATDMFNKGLIEGNTPYGSVAEALAAFEAAWPFDPYLHYIEYGSFEGINPSNLFDESEYLAAKLAALQANEETADEWADKTVDDVLAAFKAAGLSSLGHYIAYGKDEGIPVTPVPPSEQVDAGDGSVPGETFVLTTGVDNVIIETPNTADTITGTIDGSAWSNFFDTSTYSNGDNIEGNGYTVLDLVVEQAGTAAIASVDNVSQINFTAGDSGWLYVNAALWSDIGSVNLDRGMDGLYISVDQLHAGADLSISSMVAGTMVASYTDDRGVWIGTDRKSAISYEDGGDVTGFAAADGWSGFSLWAEDDGVPLTVGDITITGDNNASWVYAGVYNWQDKGGDITVGDVVLTGADWAGLYVYNTDHTSAAPAVNTTVGDVTMAVNDSGSLDLYIENTSDGKVGNLTVGDISAALGDDAYGDFFIDNDGYGAAGDLTVGSIDIDLGESAYAWLSMSNDAWAAGNAATTIGNTVIGDITLTLAKDSTFYLDLDNDARANNANATMGDTTVGALAATLAQAAYLTLDIDLDASVNWGGGGVATIGDVSIGDVNVDMAMDSTLYYSVDIEAYGHKSGIIGDVTIGALDLNMGVNGYAYFSYELDAYGTDETSTNIQGVTVGNVNAMVDDGSDLRYYFYVDSDGNIGNVSIGDLNVTAGVSASAYFSYEISADANIGDVSFGDINFTLGQNADAYFYGWDDLYASSGDIGDISVGDINIVAGVDAYFYMSNSATAYGDIGNVTFGDLTVSAAKSADVIIYNEISASKDMGNVTIGNISLNAAENAYIYASHDFSAWDQAIGAVAIGDISVSAAKNATAYYNFYMSGETAIGNVAIGNVSISAIGQNAYASVYMDIENDGVGTIGAITAGNVDMTVNGDAAGAYFYLSASSAASIGTMTVGDLNLSLGTLAEKTAWLDVNIGNDEGDVVVGDINLTGTSVRAAGDLLMFYSADVSIWADGDVTIGDITVAGGDGVADTFNNLGFLWTGAGGTVTIGDVDYSGYGAAATIDVSGYQGAGAVTGSAFGDLIIDNGGANVLTGNAGADIFSFVDDNAGNLTLATMDLITDFNNAAGDKIQTSLGTIGAAVYGEAIYADFDAFVAGAAAADKSILVGQIGSDSIVAVDYNNDNTVDYMIMLMGVTTADIDVASFV